MSEPNPLQVVLRRNLGLDAFSLDGDDTDVQDSWTDRPRRPKAAAVEVVPQDSD
jgi:hypothetical protein